MPSGVNGSNCILSSTAKLRVDNKMIAGALLIEERGGYTIQFHGPCSVWKGKKLVLCSPTNFDEVKVFKSLDDAVSRLSAIGIE
ncbi:MAG: hypothetical protein KKC43_05495 [Alphaproteobacteria bacterium]|nr:hypothetical protein [Alphaproteobacteria bacterium]